MNEIEEKLKKIYSLFYEESVNSIELDSNKIKVVLHNYIYEFKDNFLTLEQNFKDFIPICNVYDKEKQEYKFYIFDNDEIYNKVEELYNWSIFDDSSESVKNINNVTTNISHVKTYCDKFFILKYENVLLCLIDTINCIVTILRIDNIQTLSMINLITLLPFLAIGEIYQAHAGCVKKNSNCLLLYNDSMKGKTSFELLFCVNGWQIVAEDIVIFNKRGQVLNFSIRDYFHIRQGTYQNFKNFFSSFQVNDEERMKNDDFCLYKEGKTREKSIKIADIAKINTNSSFFDITHVLKVEINPEINGFVFKKTSSSEFASKCIRTNNKPTNSFFKILFDKSYHVEKNEEIIKIAKNFKSGFVCVDLEYLNHYKEIEKFIDALE